MRFQPVSTSPALRSDVLPSRAAAAVTGGSCILNVIELDDFADWDCSGRCPGSCSDRPCQYLCQSQSSPTARNRSYYPTPRNLYSSRLNYPARLSRCCFLRYCPRSSLHWTQHRSRHRQRRSRHRRPHHHRPHPHHHRRLGQARRCSGRAPISIQLGTVLLSTYRSPSRPDGRATCDQIGCSEE
jgi:hypothetical protein